IHLETHPDDPRLRALVERRSLDEAGHTQLVAAIRGGGAINASIDVARDFIRRGREELSRLPEGPERLALTEFAETIIDRNK
ncbi:MAG TPA: hypothetical protein VHP14_18975, partial [Anaerolineales bacterium]|nr:hypothetical protein [Anaerolineales bacterium]